MDILATRRKVSIYLKIFNINNHKQNLKIYQGYPNIFDKIIIYLIN